MDAFRCCLAGILYAGNHIQDSAGFAVALIQIAVKPLQFQFPDCQERFPERSVCQAEPFLYHFIRGG